MTNDSETKAEVYLTFTSSFLMQDNNYGAKSDVSVTKDGKVEPIAIGVRQKLHKPVRRESIKSTSAPKNTTVSFPQKKVDEKVCSGL